MAYSEEIGGMTTSARKRTGETYATYKDAADANLKIEKKIGLSLAKNANLTKIAAKITEKAKVKSYGELDEAGKKKTDGQVGAFGGAAAFKEGWGTLGSSVSAVMTEIEKDPATKAKYSVSHTTDHPYFPKDQKKPEFDKPIAECKWEELTPDIRQHLNRKAQAQVPAQAQPAFAYDTVEIDTKRALLNDYRYENNSIDSEAIKYLSAGIPHNIRRIVTQKPIDRAAAKAAIIQAIATAQEPLKTQLGTLLDIVVDRHTSGDHTNIVSMNKDGGAKDQWIKDTVTAGKPIISGPSGHTLRYLNFWAEKRNENIIDAQKHEEWPSLEAARLVMMADLLPPRHHTYDEVMTASIGIKDNATSPLKYNNKASYNDLLIHDQPDAKPIARKAYQESNAIEIIPNERVERKIDADINARKTYQATKTAILQGIESLFINPTPENKQKIAAIQGQLNGQ